MSSNFFDEFEEKARQTEMSRNSGKIEAASLYQIFQSGSVVQEQGRKKLLEMVNQNDGTLTSIEYQSHERLASASSMFLGAGRRTRRSKRVSRRHGGSATLSTINQRSESTLFPTRRGKMMSQNNRILYESDRTSIGQRIKDKNALKLKQIEERIINNTNNRKLIEETSIMHLEEMIKKHVYQPRVAKYGPECKKEWNEFSLLIKKGEVYDNPTSNKPCQDCIATSSWKNYEVVVVCDGHGKSGEEVSWQVANFISGGIVKQIVEVCKESEDPDKMFNEATSRERIEKIFQICDDEVIWTRELRNWTWAKIIGGKFKGLMCQVTSPDHAMNEIVRPKRGLSAEEELDEEVAVTVFKNGQRSWLNRGRWEGMPRGEGPPDRQLELPIEQQLIERKHLRCERDFFGGSTCVVFMRNKKTNEFKYATSGDSRVLFIPGDQSSQFPLDETMIPLRGKAYHGEIGWVARMFRSSGKKAFKESALLSVEHNIHDPRELARLNRDYPGCFVVGDIRFNEGVEGYMYSNALFPFTGGITPTRGFGDRLYYGSGYVSTPEISKTYVLSPGSFVIGGSDGVFDDAIWGPDMNGLVYQISQLKRQKKSSREIISFIQEETVNKCVKWGHFRVDDISLFGLQIGKNDV